MRHPFLEPPGFLKKHMNQHDRGDGNRDDRIEDSQNDDVNQDLCLEGHGRPPEWGLKKSGDVRTGGRQKSWITGWINRTADDRPSIIPDTMAVWFVPLRSQYPEMDRIHRLNFFCSAFFPFFLVLSAFAPSPFSVS